MFNIFTFRNTHVMVFHFIIYQYFMEHKSIYRHM